MRPPLHDAAFDPESTINDEIARAVGAVVAAGGPFVDGPRAAAFERELAAYCGTRHAVGVGTGMDALRLALLAVNAGPRTEVITVSHGSLSTVAAIAQVGATPRFVDIDAGRGTLDPSLLEDAITERTAAIVAVHAHGMPADMNPILDIAGAYGLAVIEEASQAPGARYRGEPVGSLGDLACFDLSPGNPLGAVGDAGAVTTGSGELAAAVRALAADESTGWQSRLDEVQAAALGVQLSHLDGRNSAASTAAGRYRSLFSVVETVDLPLDTPETGTQAVFSRFVMRCADPLALAAVLEANGISPHTDRFAPVHRSAAFADRHAGRPLPVTEAWAATAIALPLPLI